MGLVGCDCMGRDGARARGRNQEGSFEMKKTRTILMSLAALGGAAMAADTADTTLDRAIKSAESEIVSLVEVMPANRFDFAPGPSQGEFKGVRTFALQARHI